MFIPSVRDRRIILTGKLPQPYRTRAIELARMIEKYGKNHFDMSVFINLHGLDKHGDDHGLKGLTACGTAACIMGWAVTLSETNRPLCMITDVAEVDGERIDAETRAALYLGLDEYQTSDLFYYCAAGHMRDNKLAAEVLRHYAQTGEVAWDIEGDQVVHVYHAYKYEHSYE